MKDAIALGTGNSRYLKIAAGSKTKYATLDAFMDALERGEVLIDLAGINPDGWAQLGTGLDKAHLLTDTTAALMDLGTEATVNDALATLAQKTNGLITYGTEDLPDGSPLATGTIYVKYE